jgi:K+-sensing histidine kinase KdpD
MGLTVLSYFLTPTLKQTGLFNTAISLLVVGLTTYLALAIESARTVTSALTEANQLRDALIGSVSHELRTPLASILGGVSILAETPSIANDKRLSSLAHGVRNEALRLNNDIQNLLDAARISSQGLQSRRDWADPADIVNAAVERIRARHPDHLFGPITVVSQEQLENAALDVMRNVRNVTRNEKNICRTKRLSYDSANERQGSRT